MKNYFYLFYTSRLISRNESNFISWNILGCVGGINAFANVFGSELCHMVDLFKQGKLKEAAEIQRRLVLPNSLVSKYTLIETFFNVCNIQTCFKIINQ